MAGLPIDFIIHSFEQEEWIFFGGKEMKRNGFTLVEIMITIGILCLIIAIALPGLVRMRGTARTVQIQAELSSLYKAFTMLFLDTNRFPQNLSEFSKYITINNIENKYELNPNLP